MSMLDYEIAVEKIADYAALQDFSGMKPNTIVVAAEQILGYPFPETYRRFLSEWGAGSFGSSEIYGIVNDDFEHSSVPNGIWYTLKLRMESFIPPTLVAIYDVGDGELFCLDLSAMHDNEAPIVTFTPGGSLDQRREQIAEDFGRFFLDIVQREIGYFEEEANNP